MTDISHKAEQGPVLSDGFTPRPSHSKWVSSFGWPTAGAGLCIIAFGVIVGVMAFSISFSRQDSSFVGVLILVVLSQILLVVGIKCFNRGRRFFAIRNEYLVLEDPRRKVIYFRSFVDDRKTAIRCEGVQLSKYVPFLPDIIYLTEEECIAGVLGRVGPTLAIGMPGEKMPRIGIPRVYISNDHWETAIPNLISEAALVVVRAGRTDGVWKEIEMVGKYVSPERLVFLIPFGVEYELCDEFRKRINELFSCEVPLPYGNRVGGTSITNVLYFKPDWSPVCLQSKTWSDTTERVCRRGFCWLMRSGQFLSS